MKITHSPDPRPKRKAEYPDIGDQLDAIWKAIDALVEDGAMVPVETVEMLAKIKAVKGKYAKKR